MNNLSNERLEQIAMYGAQYNTPEARQMASELLILREVQSNPVYQERRFHVDRKSQIEYWADVSLSTYGYLHESQRRILYTAGVKA